MDHWARDSIRASILCDLNEFVPVNYFEGVTSGMSQGQADTDLAMKLRTDSALKFKMNARQRVACDVLLLIGMWESSESMLFICRTNKEKISLCRIRLEEAFNQLRENLKNENCNTIGTLQEIGFVYGKIEENLRAVQELDINEKKIISDLKTVGSPDLRTTLQEYVQYLPDNEAKPILYYLANNTDLSYLTNNTEQAPAGAKIEVMEQTGAKVEAEEQAAADDDDYEGKLAAMFDPVPVETLETLFPAHGKWKIWADKAARNGLKKARLGRAMFNPYLAGLWFIRKGAKGWSYNRLLKTIADILPARSRDNAHWFTDDIS